MLQFAKSKKLNSKDILPPAVVQSIIETPPPS